MTSLPDCPLHLKHRLQERGHDTSKRSQQAAGTSHARGGSSAVLAVIAAAAARRGRGLGSIVGRLRRRLILGDGGTDADLRRADAGARRSGGGFGAGHGDNSGGRHRRRRRRAEDAGVRATWVVRSVSWRLVSSPLS